MTLTVPAGRSPVGIQQLTTGAGVFSGVSPAPATQTLANGMNKFGALTAGGLFNFEQEAPMTVMQYHFDLGASVAYVISIVNLDAAGAIIAGESLQIDAATARYPASRIPFVLGVRQALQIVVAGAAVRLGQVWGVVA